MVKKLLIIPVFHSEAEMGSVKQEMKDISEKVIGRESWERHRKYVKEFWEKVESSLEKRLKKTDISKVRIYQDGQVVDGYFGVKIAEEIASAGSKNHQIILSLVKKGAGLMKTESFELLKEEYTFIKKIMGAKKPRDAEVAAALYKKRKNSLLKERDRYIAKNIDKTLKNGEFGILFIGATHNVESELPSSIKVEYLEEVKELSSKLLEMLREAGRRT
ncbi:MAG: hypothetical protein QMC80_07835 [Thermoplasmatales archaeon]|nr:hypothetical protein [Thermoplasmatales archaeon]